jgi:hypothetical protein
MGHFHPGTVNPPEPDDYANNGRHLQWAERAVVPKLIRLKDFCGKETLKGILVSKFRV